MKTIHKSQYIFLMVLFMTSAVSRTKRILYTISEAVAHYNSINLNLNIPVIINNRRSANQDKGSTVPYRKFGLPDILGMPHISIKIALHQDNIKTVNPATILNIKLSGTCKLNRQKAPFTIRSRYRICTGGVIRAFLSIKAKLRNLLSFRSDLKQHALPQAYDPYIKRPRTSSFQPGYQIQSIDVTLSGLPVLKAG